MIILSHNCYWLGIQIWLSWMVLAKYLQWGCSKDVSWGFSHLNAWLELEDPLPTWLNHMDVGRRPQFLVMWVSVELLRCLSEMATGFPQSKWFMGKNKEEVTMLLRHSVKSHILHHILSITSKSLSPSYPQGKENKVLLLEGRNIKELVDIL